MKKLLLSFLIAFSLISSAFAAPEKKVKALPVTTFERNRQANNAKWKITDNFAKATFVADNKSIEAYFNLNGDFIGTCQAITINDLPIWAKRSLVKKYESYIVKEAIEFNGVERTAYFISAENEKRSVVLKVENSSISIYKVSDKN